MELPIEIRRQKEDHPDYLDFTGFDFPEEKRLYAGYQWFNEVFIGIEEVAYVFFTDSTFRNNVNWAHIEFQRVTFSKTTFLGNSRFRGTKFHGDVDFLNTTFHGYVSFKNVTFEDLALFNFCTFHKDVEFLGVTFKSIGSFNDSTFHDDVDFTAITLFSDLGFSSMNIKSHFVLQISEWKSPGNRDQTIYLTDVKIDKIGKLKIDGKIGKKTKKYYSGISFANTDLQNVEFVNEKWIEEKMYPASRILVMDEIFLKKDNNYSESADVVSHIYRRLRDNYEKTKRYSDAGKFYISEMEIKRKYSESVFDRLLYSIYSITSRYGESIFLPILWTIIFIMSIALFRCIIFNQPSKEQFIFTYQKCLSSTVKAFFPFNRITLIRDIITRLIGTSLLGVALVALRRKFERK